MEFEAVSGVGFMLGVSSYLSLEYNSSSSGLDRDIGASFVAGVVVTFSNFSCLIARDISVDFVLVVFASLFVVAVILDWVLVVVVGGLGIDLREIDVVDVLGDLWLESLFLFVVVVVSGVDDRVKRLDSSVAIV